MSKRPSWDQYFMDITRVVARRSTCLRRQVGALIVLDKRILTTGYNGAPAGLEHCASRGCLRAEKNVPPGERHELCRGLHAEQNAIIQAALHGIQIRSGLLYGTHFPCVVCAKMLANSGISRVVIAEGYPDELSQSVLKEAGITVRVLGNQRT